MPNHRVAIAAAMIRGAKEASLAVKGDKLFNLPPATICNIVSGNVEIFCKDLDSFLSYKSRISLKLQATLEYQRLKAWSIKSHHLFRTFIAKLSSSWLV